MKKDLMRLVDLMLSISHLIRQGSKRSRRVTPLSAIGLRTLMFISSRKRVTMSDVADHLGVRAPTATSMINHLAKEKLVSRAATGGDRRIVLLQVTSKGRQEAQKVLERVGHKFNLLFQGLSAKDKNQFIKTLEKIIQNYQKINV